jgi:hypothetical protein
MKRYGFAAVLIAAAAISIAGCNRPPDPETITADNALFWINDYLPTGYSMWRGGQPFESISTCADANGSWIAGCGLLIYENPRPLTGPSDSGWSYWQVDERVDFGNGNSETTTACFGVIPPYGDVPTQLYESSCTNVGDSATGVYP